MDLIGLVKTITAVAETTAKTLPIDGQQLMLIMGGLLGLLIVLLLLILLKRLRARRDTTNSSDTSNKALMLTHSLEEIALDAEALEELYHKGYISAALFLEEATAYKHQADLLQQYLLNQPK